MMLARKFSVLLALVLPASLCSAQTVLSLDASRTSDGGFGGSNFYLTSPVMATATQTLIGAGYTVSTTDRFVSANLAGVSVLYTGLVATSFTPQELTDIQAFVGAGGGLIITRDIFQWGDPVDPLAAAFGVVYDPALSGIGGTPSDMVATTPHPIWSGVAGSVSAIGQTASCSILSGAVVIGSHVTDGKSGLGVLSFGSGSVVFLTDSGSFLDGQATPAPDPGNAHGVFWLNMFAFVGGPPVDPGTGYCFGDTTGGFCPCSAYGATGQGCANTSGSGATMIGVGLPSIALDTLRLEVVGVPGAKPGLILRGDNQVSVPAGDGLLCTAGNSMRSQVQITSGGATIFNDFKGAGFGAVANIGSATNFQFWYRDPGNACGQGGFNFSNGVSVVYQP